MTPLDALLELLERVGASHGAAVLVSEAELSLWPSEAVRQLKLQKLLVKASPAVSVVCPGCEQECVMEVHTPPSVTGPAASFVICDKRDDINRVQYLLSGCGSGAAARKLWARLLRKAWDCSLRANGRLMQGCGSLAL